MSISTVDWDRIKGKELIPQAVLHHPPSYFENRFGTEFEDGLDDLDWHKSILLALDDRLIFCLQQYRGHDPETTTIYLPLDLADIDDARYVEVMTAAIARILQSLGFGADDLVWQRSDNPDY